ncbi:MAG: hypothetical protein HC913_21210 [Microscillaceae bacterium]|nr:hypothetical protein [Microscillaceae bacterium]
MKCLIAFNQTIRLNQGATGQLPQRVCRQIWYLTAALHLALVALLSLS